MKNLVLITIVFLALQAKSQENFIKMLGDNVVWHYKTDPLEFQTYFYQYYTDGDTVMDNKTYYKLFHNFSTNSDFLYGYIREDDEGKVYIRYAGIDSVEPCGGFNYPTNEDLLFMDFGAEVGDSILVVDSIYNPYSDTEYAFIIDVQVEEIAGQMRRKIEYSSFFSGGFWIEGIGSGFYNDFDQMYCGIGEWFTELLCFVVNDSIVYSMDDNCLVGISENSKTNLGLEIFPNPSNDMINISVTENVKVAKVRVYEVSGRVLLVQSPIIPLRQGTIALDVSQLKPGMYLIEVETENGFREVKRIVVE
jgi:hypothetical protein